MSADANTLARALEWVHREWREDPGADKLRLVERAALRFDLGPLDEEWLLRHVRNPGPKPSR